MANCPDCNNPPLRHTLLSDDLPAHACGSCDGVLLSLVAYRAWRDHHGPPEPTPPAVDASVEVDEAQSARTCPKCRGLMTRYRIASQVSNRLDYCPRCEEVWLDDGEWALVEELARSGHLAAVFTQPWQARVRRELSAGQAQAQLRDILGDDWDYFVEFSQWLDKQSARDRLLSALRQGRH